MQTVKLQEKLDRVLEAAERAVLQGSKARAKQLVAEAKTIKQLIELGQEAK
jgi:hypothetical protein